VVLLQNMEIIPAIIGETSGEVKEKIEKVKGLVNWVQIDVVDGKFAEPESWGTKIGDNLHLWEGENLPKIEIHLMVENPQLLLDDWVSTSVDRVLIHAESKDDIKKLVEGVKKIGTQVGVALKLETDVSVIEPYAKELDVVQLLSIATIGKYGASFDEAVYEKIKNLRARYPDVTIEIDGGVGLDNAKQLIEAGAENLVIGSAIFKSGNIPDAIEQFKSLK
jgi:ribulose-phosphate 3-epimerase